MPYNTSAIPPRKEPTGHTQLPLSRVKKIISHDSDIAMCSNNAAFVMTCAAEMFIQHLAEAALTQTKLERKPRHNIQYKDIANAVSHQDNLEFLEDVVPKTVPFNKIKATARDTQARLRDDKLPADRRPAVANGKAPAAASIVVGQGIAFGLSLRPDDRVDDPNEQLELEMRQAARGGPSRHGDVHMSG